MQRYCFLFFHQERISTSARPQLAFPIPIAIEKAISGYLRQLSGVFHFIKVGVFIGALSAQGEGPSNIDAVAANLDSAADLNPPFVDTYYYSQSFVASTGPAHVQRANEILNKGMLALPENWMVPFFMGFNQFYYLDAPGEAAETLRAASLRPKAPSWLGHLASVLAAKGGNISTGLNWLIAMRETEKDDLVRRGYEEDIADYKMALEVQQAIAAYREKYSRDPNLLDELIPEFLDGLPEFKGNFVLNWEPPVLRMERPSRK